MGLGSDPGSPCPPGVAVGLCVHPCSLSLITDRGQESPEPKKCWPTSLLTMLEQEPAITWGRLLNASESHR